MMIEEIGGVCVRLDARLLVFLILSERCSKTSEEDEDESIENEF
jgi:hypothetical protein